MSQNTESANFKEYVTRLNNRGIIQLTGEERVKYLQGQVTADIHELSEKNSLLACHCDFKGKIWSVFYAINWQDSILLISHQSVLQKSLAELNKYGVFAKVEITDATTSWEVSAGKGAELENAIEELFGELPSGHQGAVSNKHGIAISIEQPTQRYLVLQPNNKLKQLDCEVSNQENLWEVDDIKSGIGEIRETTSNEYVPQMLNLQLLNAINFEKGCYMGQEVVARTKYLGRNKRAGFILKSDKPATALAGEQLEYQIGENWRPGGKILRCGTDETGQTWAFAILANDTEVPASFRVKSQPETIFVTQPLPYDIQ